ncbi:hypothetical protein Aab01nite_08260 [Paractinoplanes abujensis]|nr:hypothetical protein Aab01nite_08260 [Actinoplanes abujensis]
MTEPGSTVSNGNGEDDSNGNGEDDSEGDGDTEDDEDEGDGDGPASSPPAARAVPVTPRTAAAPTAAATAYERFMMVPPGCCS